MHDPTATPSPAPGISATFAVDLETLIRNLDTDRLRGLDPEQAATRLRQRGPNRLAETPPPPRWKAFVRQFRESLVLILIVAAIIAGLMGEWIDSVAILAIVLLNGVFGFLQEDRASRALAALHNLSSPTARVVRGGALRILPAEQLVPGDRIELEAGDHIPADVRLVRSFGLRVQEAALTGESTPVTKQPHTALPADTPLADRLNMAYTGTIVSAGKATGLVVGTGMETELGRIAGLLGHHEPEPTPLQRRLSELGRVLVTVCLVAVAVIFVLQWLRGQNWVEAFLLSVSLAVAAVPEGLPAVVTMALALGLQRMARRHALIRKLPSVETLGSVTVICSDKTGTLTRNAMTVREVHAGGRLYKVTGAGYDPNGQFLRDVGGAPVVPSSDPDLLRALQIGAVCNNAQLICRDNRGWDIVGDPTEGALLVVAGKAGLPVSGPTNGDGHSLLHEFPFDSDRMMMSVIVDHPVEPDAMFTKGAPEIVLGRCVSERRDGAIVALTDDRRDRIAQVNAAMAARALRVLALAEKPLEESLEADEHEEDDLIFAGLVGMIDPPRDEAREAVRICRDAGIRPVMITGDHPETAQAIARELGISRTQERTVDGRYLDRLDDSALIEQVEHISVYARVTAEHKLRVVRAWKARGQVVAMTGDGVNDAPAVKAADIGIAMGITGTDVTREASGMVLTDDNFASIVAAVEEGRGIFENIRKFILYLLSCNAGEVLLMFVAVLLGLPAPLTAVQILWINLVTDGLPALALGMEPPERDIMRRPPRPPREPVITREGGTWILLNGTLIATASLAGFLLAWRGSETNLDRAHTVTFCTMAFSQLFYAFACRSQRQTLPQLGFFTNPYLIGAVVVSGLLQLGAVTLPRLRNVFDATYLAPADLGLMLGLALAPVTLIEVAKLVRAARRSRHAAVG